MSPEVKAVYDRFMEELREWADTQVIGRVPVGGPLPVLPIPPRQTIDGQVYEVEHTVSWNGDGSLAVSFTLSPVLSAIMCSFNLAEPCTMWPDPVGVLATDRWEGYS